MKVKVNQLKPEKVTLPWFQIAVWIYPVIALAVFNQSQIGIVYSIRVLIFTIIAAFLIGAIAKFVYRSNHKAGLANTVIALLFSTYGHLYLKIESMSLGGLVVGRHRFLIIIWLFIAFVLLWSITKLPNKFNAVVSALNAASLILILIPMVRGGIYLVQNNTSNHDNNIEAASVIKQEKNNLPDIYFIVLDAYNRQDLLKENYAYDNSGLIDFLKSKGFYVASCSQSNYNHTWFSISTSLNLDYLSAIFPNGKDVRPVPLIKHSLLRQQLEELGYKTVAFETGYAFTEITDADYYFQPEGEVNLINLFTGKMNAFELLYGQTTAASAILELRGISLADMKSQIKRDRMEYIYRQMLTVPEMAGPKFVYAHIDTTHPPFVYSADDINPDTINFLHPAFDTLGGQSKGYGYALAYSDSKIPRIINNILEKSKTPPIIILEGDHGPFLRSDFTENLSNLTAVYLGGKSTKSVLSDDHPGKCI